MNGPITDRPETKNIIKTHVIEWKRLVRQGRTCNRCGDTGETLRKVVRELNAGCGAKQARFRLKTTRLPATRVAESNSILIDGWPLEQIVPGVAVTETECDSCGELLGRTTQCRAVTVDGRTHDAVPAELIRSAICRVANCCGEDCNCGCGCGEAGAKSRTGKAQAANGPQCCDLNPARSRRLLKH
jgi:hypothetical protein